MIFNSVVFLVYLPVVVALYWLLPRTPRLLMLFAASIVFYGFWRFDFTLLLLASIVADFALGIAMGRTEHPVARKALLVASVTMNLSIIVFFKYTLFLLGSANSLLELLGIGKMPLTFQIILPLGVSFYIFHSMGYIVDVYRRVAKPERDFLVFANFVIFFPQLVAGPILRAGEVMWQLDRRPKFQLADLALGLERILLGLFLKVVLADPIGEFVDSGYAGIATADYGGIDAWTLAFLFGFQIYFDFSAYSHIAIGAARLCGVHFPENFNFPYAARTPREFWKRWHISLSSWIRDYLYSPLCGVRGGTESRGGIGAVEPAGDASRRNRALLLTWAIMGLWHGANWTFLAWGLWHGGLVLAFRRLKLGDGSVWTWLVTLPLVMLGWVFFRAQSLAEALKLIGAAFNPLAYLPREGTGLLARLHLQLPPNVYLITFALLLATLAAWWAHVRIIPALRRAGGAMHFGAQVAVFTVAIGAAFIYFRPAQLFIYFQF